MPICAGLRCIQVCQVISTSGITCRIVPNLQLVGGVSQYAGVLPFGLGGNLEAPCLAPIAPAGGGQSADVPVESAVIRTTEAALSETVCGGIGRHVDRLGDLLGQ